MASIALLSTADAKEVLLASSTSACAARCCVAEPPDTAPDARNPLQLPAMDVDNNGLVTCLFSFGSTGVPKPLWFDALQWAEWGERNPPVSRRARAALARRSVRVSCAALFAPLSHGLARRTAWGELCLLYTSPSPRDS